MPQSCVEVPNYLLATGDDVIMGTPTRFSYIRRFSFVMLLNGDIEDDVMEWSSRTLTR